jgi:hypothetical protein
MIICIGGCCVPVHLLLAFLVAAAHRHGYLTWFKEDWVRYGWWRSQIKALLERLTTTTGRPPAATNAATNADTKKKE